MPYTLKPPFFIYDKVHIGEDEGHLCTCDTPEIAQAILAALCTVTGTVPDKVEGEDRREGVKG